MREKIVNNCRKAALNTAGTKTKRKNKWEQHVKEGVIKKYKMHR